VTNEGTLKIFIHEGVDPHVRPLWRRVIATSYMSVLPEVQAVVPPFYIYNTLNECLHHTFNPSHPAVDKLAEQFAFDKVWSFAFLQSPELRNANIPEDNFQRILVASSRNGLTPDLSPEMVILHEIGHFHMFINEGVPYNVANKRDVEDACNRFALEMYARLLVMNPQYTTASNDPHIQNMEGVLKAFAAKRKGEGFSEDEVERQIQIILRSCINEACGQS